MITVYTQSNIGRRESNQDRYASLRFSIVGALKADEVFVVIVADGMGGHSCGEIYAERAISFISSRIGGLIAQADMQRRHNNQSIREALRSVFDRELDSLFNKVNCDLVTECDAEKMALGGTTASVCLIHADKAYFLNAGDSPIYLYNAYTETAEEIGVRDNLSETLVREGKISRNSDDYHYNSSRLLSFFGMRKGYGVASELNSHFTSRELTDGDVILMGSDGAFGNEITSAQPLAAFLKTVPGISFYCKELLAKAAFSTDDNQTLAVIRYAEDENRNIPADSENTEKNNATTPSAPEQPHLHPVIRRAENKPKANGNKNKNKQIPLKGWFYFGKH